MTASKSDPVALTTGENLAVGAFGGALETCLQMPVLTYKFCLQEGRPLPTSIPGWYRGVFVQAGTVAPITAIQFMFNGILQAGMIQVSKTKQLSDGQVIAAAAGAGAISAIVYSPVDLLTIQQQKLHTNLWNTFNTLVKNYGISGLYRGFSACVAREALYTAGYLGLAPVVTSRLVAESEVLREHPLSASILGACAAGTLAAITTHPIDTAKTCIQGDMTGATWKTTFSTMKALVKAGGIASLYRGMVPRTFRLCGALFVCLMVRDAAIEYKTRHFSKLGQFPEATSVAAGLESTAPVATSAAEQ